ncbi:MAG: formylglycine-generating enzyme family protein [Gammaproteobacteria bacterium]|nr:formylglycine-generating enzyme family protein [Gammaproteobacteria bacterium]MDE0415100.1 formylglycine-generating enzyme family protein [Gammaproteobacteria bacterium]
MVFSDELRIGGRGPEMVVLPAGSFRMGCVSGMDCFDDQKPVRQVTISEPIAVSRFEITFEDYERFADSNNLDDESWGRGRRPAVNVSWDDAKQYVAWLSSQTGEAYRLLTEAEWEYAARAGSTTKYHFGNNQSDLCEYANLWDKDAGNGDAPCSDGAGLQTAEAGSYAPNAFGLHDMHGNVYEWVEDCWNASYSGAPSDGSAWLDGDCSRRVLRSSSWMDYPRDARTAIRVRFVQGLRNGVTGFRVARTLVP